MTMISSYWPNESYKESDLINKLAVLYSHSSAINQREHVNAGLSTSHQGKKGRETEKERSKLDYLTIILAQQ
jgi:hypothetical protein